MSMNLLIFKCNSLYFVQFKTLIIITLVFLEIHCRSKVFETFNDMFLIKNPWMFMYEIGFVDSFHSFISFIDKA